MTTFDRIREYQDSLSDIGIAGNDLAVYVDGVPFYRYMTGYRNIERNEKIDRNTVFRMFSMTKPLTVIAAMQLYEQGRFMLYDPLYLYLPEFREMKVREKDPDGTERLVPAKNPILISELFEMTAGFDYESKCPELSALYESTQDQFTLEEVVRVIASRPLLFEPGTHWHYSLAHDVLARLIEVVSGMRYGEYLKKNIFEPLDMKSATHHPGAEALQKLCECYERQEDGTFRLVPGSAFVLYNKPNYEGGGSGLYMTVDDYAKFACTLTAMGASSDGHRIIAASTIDVIRENHLNDALLKDFTEGNPHRFGYGYGLGVRTHMCKALSDSLSAVGEFGWSGYLGTYVLMDPATGVTIVFADQVLPKARSVHSKIRNLVYAALEYEGIL